MSTGKRLVLLRHAKSSWSNPLLRDHDRPLNKRGVRTAPEVGKWLADQGWAPDAVVSSTAARTLQTWGLIEPHLPGPVEFTVDAALYHGGLANIRAAVRRLKAQGRGGRLVSVASRQALHPMLGANTVAYTMSKAAVAAMTASLAAEVGSDGILVNAVAPGILDTSANREAMPEADSSAWVSPEALARVIGGLIAPGQQVTTGAVIPVYGAGGAGG